MNDLATTYYPGAEATPALTSSVSTMGMLSQVLIFLLLVAAAAFLAVRFMNKRRGLGTGRAGQGTPLSVEQTHSLGNRQYLVVVHYGSQDLLLGVSPGHIQTLSHHPQPQYPSTRGASGASTYKRQRVARGRPGKGD